MSNDLVVLEKQLVAMETQIGEAIPPQAQLPAARIVRTIIVSCERVPKLLDCNRQTLINAAWSAACLGLEVDGVTGQAYLIPFKGQVQLQIGFKGYGTLAARSGFILHGGVIRDGDEYLVELGTPGRISVVPKFGGRQQAKVIAAYASMESLRFPTIVDVMDVDEIEAVRKVSQMSGGAPWSQHFPQMAIKTVKKRLAKSSPLNLMHLAAALDDQGDIGNTAHIRPDDNTLVIDGKGAEVFPTKTSEDVHVPLPPFVFDFPSGKSREFQTVSEWAGFVLANLGRADDAAKLRAFIDRNRVNIAKARLADEAQVVNVEAAIEELIGRLADANPTEGDE